MTQRPFDELRPQSDEPPPWWRSRSGITFGVLGLAAAYFLLTEHLAHTIQALPWVIILLCPLMHVFMHRGHGGHGGGAGGNHDRDSEGGLR